MEGINAKKGELLLGRKALDVDERRDRRLKIWAMLSANPMGGPVENGSTIE